MLPPYRSGAADDAELPEEAFDAAPLLFEAFFGEDDPPDESDSEDEPVVELEDTEDELGCLRSTLFASLSS